MTETPVCEVTIDRISNSGNPIAEEELGGDIIIVYGAKPGQTVEVELYRHGSVPVGWIVDPTDDQEERRDRQYRWRDRFVRTSSNGSGIESKYGQKRLEDDEKKSRTKKNRMRKKQSQKMHERERKMKSEGESKREKIDKTDKEKKSWRDENKNHLANGHM